MKNVRDNGRLAVVVRAARWLLRMAIIPIIASALIGVGIPINAVADSQRTARVMTRNVDEGTDLDFILAAGSFDELLVAVAHSPTFWIVTSRCRSRKPPNDIAQARVSSHVA